MGMNVGNAGGAGDPEVMVDINTTPLIDVMLVLLIMLIITIPIQLHAVNLNLPVGTPPASDVQPEIVKIDIDADSAVFWQGLRVADMAELEHKLAGLAEMTTPPDIHLRPNKAARYAVVAAVLADTKRLGLTKIGIIGSEQFVE
ncbi:biopolymer transporter ExbD [Azoarcus indigens]|uniref:Outer membrane transport energization protein ExbD n=1 Tax=Azoarcus indigens TaxID=29545 RepID=A0A4R6DPN3_9RHOO|nr:biopolymer transporter ExbD [Azoarcus indigens]NMG67296.1 biopolymer transporter ExbD [Azoarcus indigens]TDN46930.1 outer membrane transport energization protein ExbD [Azoarcus indigens]